MQCNITYGLEVHAIKSGSQLDEDYNDRHNSLTTWLHVVERTVGVPCPFLGLPASWCWRNHHSLANGSGMYTQQFLD